MEKTKARKVLGFTIDILALGSAITNEKSTFTPETSGKIAYFARATPPTGWLKCNGATVSRTAYADLFASIGTTFGEGDGITTFGLPDLRGQFIRSWADNGITYDSGRVFGTTQTDQIENHEHNVYTNTNTSGRTTGANNAYAGWNGSVWTSTINHGTTGIVNGRYSTKYGTETRPCNIALLACIKY